MSPDATLDRKAKRELKELGWSRMNRKKARRAKSIPTQHVNNIHRRSVLEIGEDVYREEDDASTATLSTDEWV